MKTLTTLFCAMLFSGCAALRPISIPIELDHVSHVSQHFGSERTNYGYNAVALGLKFRPLPYTTVVLSEGVSLDHHYTYRGRFPETYGALMGPRELTTIRTVIEIPLR